MNRPLTGFLAIATCLTTSLPTFVAASPVPAGTLLAAKQELVRSNDAEVATLNPLNAEGLPEMHVIRDLFEGLVIQDAQGNVIPGMAERWENEKNQVFTFYLRPDAKWSNGDPVTASDFVYSLRRAVDPLTASPNAWYLKLTNIANAKQIIEGKQAPEQLGVTAIDAHTLRFNLDKPVPYFLAMLVHTVMMPVHQASIKAHPDTWARPGNLVSNGAFVLDKWVVNEKITLKRNSNYWNDRETTLNQVTYIPFENQMSAYNRYRSGEVDITSDVPAQMAQKLQKELPDAYQISPLLCTYYYAFNTQRAPLNDARVRQALSYSIMRDVVTNGITDSGHLPAYTFAHKEVAGFKASLPEYAKLSQKQRDEKARELLKEAGINKDNPASLNLLYNTSESHKSIAVGIAAMWNKTLGLNVTLENQEWKSYLDSRKNGQFDILRASWCGDYNEASTFLSLFTSDNDRNFAFYANPEYDEVMKQAQTETEVSKRNKLYDKAEGILSADMPIAPIYFFMQARLVRPNVGGVPTHNAEGRIYSKNLYIKRL
ncbi:oligopeptide ABC transporter substrate-binding protein OppA [Vibrio sp. UCD-FRSSP16_10]|uniref:peptide ABC transporter substrate-binding protein n=1 Tax=unclassified Vibrio TaxID=2614977 RepID=UPI0008003CA1|nr:MULTISPECIES: peptide ABC transporter substrate-binding protein [unclassified Vibrio]OBT13438.1 oligopeptide ABC transporter substrate-binding protein OppA [Vibrio sp. UCD-FRSSP16_10]OBT17948.1 oligopeptide ABC transporter substrate-binding protein OppA [Vibrio sp. UCD-FRSSP16_30]